MFRDIPGCSGMFRVPGFIDALCSRKIDDFRKNFDLSDIAWEDLQDLRGTSEIYFVATV